MKRSEQYVLNMGIPKDRQQYVGVCKFIGKNVAYFPLELSSTQRCFGEHLYDLKIQNVDYYKREDMRLVKSPDLLCIRPFRLHPRPLGCAFKFLCPEVPPKGKPKNFWTMKTKGRELLLRKCLLCANYHTRYFTYISSFLMPTMTLQKALFH